MRVARLLLLVAVVAWGCSDETGPGHSRTARVWIGATGLVVAPGESLQLGASVLDTTTRQQYTWPGSLSNPWPPDLAISWRSKDPSTVTVDQTGRVRAIRPGKTVVWAQVEDKADSGTIFVGASNGIPRAFATVAPGAQHTCALDETGTAFCWGSDFDGPLGQGTIRAFTDRPLAAPVAGGLAFATLIPGLTHTCGLTAAGAAHCWGEDFYGELGDGADFTTFDEVGAFGRGQPVLVRGGLTFAALAAGGFHTCGLDASGAGYCWGWNGFGQLGIGSFAGSDDRRTQPAAMTGGLHFTHITAGPYHSCALVAGGAAYCWGLNDRGQLGRDSTEIRERCGGTRPCSISPIAVSGGIAFTALTAGTSHTCGLASDGAAYCWGANSDGQLGVDSVTATITPQPVSGGLRFTTISAGVWHVCGLTSSGVAYCWGQSNLGQLGNGASGTLDPTFAPVPVAGNRTFVMLRAGQSHTCGVEIGGAMYCWGWNKHGQIGNGQSEAPDARDNLVASTPVRVLDPPAQQ